MFAELISAAALIVLVYSLFKEDSLLARVIKSSLTR